MQEQPDRGDDSNDSSESGQAPSIDESSDDDGGLSIGEDSGMGSMAGSDASDIFDLADSHDLSDVVLCRDFIIFAVKTWVYVCSIGCILRTSSGVRVCCWCEKNIAIQHAVLRLYPG